MTKESLEEKPKSERAPELKLPENEFWDFVGKTKRSMSGSMIAEKELKMIVLNFVRRLVEIDENRGKSSYIDGEYYTSELCELFKKAGVEVPHGVVDALRGNTREIITIEDSLRKAQLRLQKLDSEKSSLPTEEE